MKIKEWLINRIEKGGGGVYGTLVVYQCRVTPNHAGFRAGEWRVPREKNK
jgi:hypothetical protein